MSENTSTHVVTGNPVMVQAYGIFLPDVDIPFNLPRHAIGIADMANAFGVTHRTLHFYEEKQLISAGRAGLMRVYDREQVIRMAIITACRETGMAVAVIQELMQALGHALSQESANEIFMRALETRRRELTSEQSTIMRQLHRLNGLIEDASHSPGEANDNISENDFSEQELACLALMSEGYSTARLVRALQMEPQDVTELETRIIRKFGANNRFQAVAKAVLLGVIQ
jgi:DNA-binding transcriptional MerR regulator